MSGLTILLNEILAISRSFLLELTSAHFEVCVCCPWVATISLISVQVCVVFFTFSIVFKYGADIWSSYASPIIIPRSSHFMFILDTSHLQTNPHTDPYLAEALLPISARQKLTGKREPVSQGLSIF